MVKGARYENPSAFNNDSDNVSVNSVYYTQSSKSTTPNSKLRKVKSINGENHYLDDGEFADGIEDRKIVDYNRESVEHLEYVEIKKETNIDEKITDKVSGIAVEKSQKTMMQEKLSNIDSKII